MRSFCFCRRRGCCCCWGDVGTDTGLPLPLRGIQRPYIKIAVSTTLLVLQTLIKWTPSQARPPPNSPFIPGFSADHTPPPPQRTANVLHVTRKCRVGRNKRPFCVPLIRTVARYENIKSSYSGRPKLYTHIVFTVSFFQVNVG